MDQSPQRPPLRIIGYHGTIASSVSGILSGAFFPSENAYDWLGHGVYFFQDAPHRALEWAHEHIRRKNLSEEPAVIGAVLNLESCLDLLDVTWAGELRLWYHHFCIETLEAGDSIPVQKDNKLHYLDCDVMNYAIKELNKGGIGIMSVRGAFSEGSPIYPESKLFSHSHVQISILDQSIIEGKWQADITEGR